MTVLAVILARAGSVGLKNKHLLPLLGQPVIQYTFDHAHAARLLSRVVVSSDCTEILQRATREGFGAIQRPPELATSDASVQGVMLHAMKLAEADGARFDGLVVLYGNVPVRAPGVIDQAITKLTETGCDSVRSFTPVGKWHPWWMSRLEGDRIVPVQPGSIHRRQDLPPLFLHDGGVVAVSRASMLRGQANPADPHAFFGEDRRGIEVAMGDVVEIDHLRDLYWAEAVLREQKEQARHAG